METKHTPGKWDYKPTSHGDFNICEKAGLAVAVVVQNGFRPPQETMANAAFIVKACNCHDELVGALEDVLSCLAEPFVMKGKAKEYAQAAIAKAKGESQ